MRRAKGDDPFIVALIPGAVVLEISDISTSVAKAVGPVFDKSVEVIAVGIGLGEKLPLNKPASLGFCQNSLQRGTTIFEREEHLARPGWKIDGRGKRERNVPNGVPFGMKGERIRNGRNPAKNSFNKSNKKFSNFDFPRIQMKKMGRDFLEKEVEELVGIG
jgi:hypothetical protein